MEDYNQYKKIAQLIAKETFDVIDQSELEELQSWMNELPENKELYYQIKNAKRFNEWKLEYEEKAIKADWKEFNKTVKKQKPQNVIFLVFKYAAIISFPLLIAAGGYFLFFKQNNPIPLELQAQHIKPGGTKAILIMDNGQSVVLDTPEKVVLTEKDGTNIEKSEGTLSYSNLPESDKDEIIFNTISIPRGGEYVVILSDGTTVHLNSLTELKYPVNFQGNVREVELTGEAWFEVAHEKSKPFIVKTGNIKTVALGTSFNINAYESTGKIITTLVQGEVKIENAGNGKSQMLNPDEQAVFDEVSNTLNVSKVDVMLYTAWKDGEFIFRNERLSDIMQTLTRWYSTDAIIDDPAIQNLHFSGSLNRYGNIQPILDIINSTGKVEIEINQNNIIFKKKK